MVKYLFALKFDKVDMFDINTQGIDACKELAKVNPVLGRVEQKSFQEWKWEYKYDAIFSIWSIGYISAQEIVQWLKRAKAQLNNPRIMKEDPKCFIWILDNFGEKEEPYKKGEQWHRPPKVLEALFEKAGLKIFKGPIKKNLPEPYGEIVIYALY